MGETDWRNPIESNRDSRINQKFRHDHEAEVRNGNKIKRRNIRDNPKRGQKDNPKKKSWTREAETDNWRSHKPRGKPEIDSEKAEIDDEEVRKIKGKESGERQCQVNEESYD